MEIKEERSGDVLVLAPDGNLSTGEECHALDERLTAAIGGGARLLVVDFARVGHLTAASLRALLLASRKLSRLDGRIVLCGMTPKVQKAFSISGFDRDFTVLPAQEAALTAVRQPVTSSRVRTPARRAAAPPGATPPSPAAAPAPPAAPSPSPRASSLPAPPAKPSPAAAAPPVSAPAAPPVDLALAARLLAALGAVAGDVASPATGTPAPASRASRALADAVLRALDAQPA